MPDKPDLLFLAPVMPAPTGNGLAMRGAMILDALAATCRVHLLVLPVADADGPRRPSAFVRERTVATVVERVSDPLRRSPAGDGGPARTAALLLAWPRPLLSRFATAELLGRLAARFGQVEFALVHVMRLYMAPYAVPFLERPAGRRPVAVLDLDDDEACTRERIAVLQERHGRPAAARIEAREAERFREFERAWLGRFESVLVCSEADKTRLSGRTDPARLTVIPNAVPLPALPALPARGADRGRRAWTILFVGTLGYFPNQDAAVHLCRDILPLIRERCAGREVRVRIVGRGPSPEVLALGRLPGVLVEGRRAGDLGGCYRLADLVVVPVRAGGGTRIKLLEALSHARPVVATRLGAEGVAVEDGRHLLLADGPEGFASACVRLLLDPALARGLGEGGRELVRARYEWRATGASLARLYRSLPGSG